VCTSTHLDHLTVICLHRQQSQPAGLVHKRRWLSPHYPSLATLPGLEPHPAAYRRVSGNLVSPSSLGRMESLPDGIVMHRLVPLLTDNDNEGFAALARLSRRYAVLCNRVDARRACAIVRGRQWHRFMRRRSRVGKLIGHSACAAFRWRRLRPCVVCC